VRDVSDTQANPAQMTQSAQQPAAQAAQVMLFGLRRGWIFERVFETVRVDVLADDWSCPWCWKEPEEPDPEALQRATTILMRKEPDADDPGRS
jgi:hypothetical protein